MTEKLTLIEHAIRNLDDGTRVQPRSSPFTVVLDKTAARLAKDCIAHTRTLAQMYELSGGDWEATGPTRELHALAARIEEQSS